MGHDSACTGLLRAFRNRPPHCRWRARVVYTMMGPRVLSIKLASPEGPSSGLDARRRWAAAGSAGGATGHVKALGPLSSQGKGAAPQRNERPAHSELGGHTQGSNWGGRGGTYMSEAEANARALFRQGVQGMTRVWTSKCD